MYVECTAKSEDRKKPIEGDGDVNILTHFKLRIIFMKNLN